LCQRRRLQAADREREENQGILLSGHGQNDILAVSTIMSASGV
jgi:hypothetical protein